MLYYYNNCIYKLLTIAQNSYNYVLIIVQYFIKIKYFTVDLSSKMTIDKLNHSFYLIPNEYVPILMKKNLLKNPKSAVKNVDNILIPTYALDNFKKKNIKKAPNAFIIFRNEMFKQVSVNNPKKSSREISIIIGKIWNQMSEESKLPYLLKSNAIKERKKQRITLKYEKFLKNIKQRDYKKTKELCENPSILSIKKLLFS